jgi:orotidine-5'-phosphate decarboxylase
MSFMQQLRSRWSRAESLLCVGLDPEPRKFPAPYRDDPDATFEFCRGIVDATAEFVCAFKPQIAHFAALELEADLEQLIDYIHATHPGIPVILDSKRGDIGSTAERYAVEAFDRYGADAVTINPYLGRDSAQPFLDRADKGVVVLCRTSNPGSGEFQDLVVDGRPLYQHVAARVANEWNANGNCLLVAGATFPRELGVVRELVGDVPFLVPGIGAQGGDVEAVVTQGKTKDGTGLVISSSRAILYAGDGDDFAKAAGAAAKKQRDEINKYR